MDPLIIVNVALLLLQLVGSAVPALHTAPPPTEPAPYTAPIDMTDVTEGHITAQ